MTSMFDYSYLRTEFGTYDTILDHIGNTPLVKLDKLKKEYKLKCDICKLNRPKRTR